MTQTTMSTSSSGSETHWFENVVVLDLDLEGQEVKKQPVVDASSAPSTPSTPARITRSQSLTRLGIQQKFTHPKSHLKTTEADVVDFDGADDPVSTSFHAQEIINLAMLIELMSINL